MAFQILIRNKLRFFLILMTIFISTNVFAQKSATDYLSKHKNTAIQLMKRTGIPASIIIGVSMIESAMGKSRNCKLLNNYFGVKGKNSLSKVANGPRSAYKEYPNAKASCNDFVRIVQTKKYYPKLKGTTDYKKWLHTMNQYGYAEAKGKWIADYYFCYCKIQII